MKKIVTSLSLLLLSFACFSQDEGGSFGQGTSVVNIGVGIGTFYWGSGVTNSLGVNPTISYEYGVTDKIGVGGNLSYSAAKYSSQGYTVKYSGVLVGPRGAYHFANSTKFDPYVGATLGYVIVSVTDNNGGGNYAAKGSGVGLGIFLGARYYPSSSVGIHAELGYTSFSFLTAGVSFRF
ncbi:MAG TPA: outer membrane beta-barrel protein [Chitinophagaceae bacterium]|nr:outer membrane beta-barrel protein [Chitinophagaceae bacterium]